MSQSTKQLRIENLFKRFAALCPDIQSTVDYQIWEDTPKDPPDVCVGEKAIGIEFMDFIHGWGEKGSPVKAREQVLDRIIENAQRDFENKHTVTLYVSFHWQGHSRPKKSERSIISQNIAQIISERISAVHDTEIELTWDDFEGTILQHHLDTISISHIPELQRNHWVNPQAGLVGFEKEAFEAITLEKEQDLPRYIYEFNSVWLVIVADGSAISSTVIPNDSVTSSRLESKFDRVYFFDSFIDRVVLLTGDEN